ncbi:MAG: hypothetical protein IKJ34_05890, partial [Mailhella sp.]|nr:hypothetical protein [Mailhella sp.]
HPAAAAPTPDSPSVSATPAPASSSVSPAPAEPETFTMPELRFRAPASFVAIEENSELFQRTAEQAVKNGRLAKLYLPRDMSRLYAEGRPDAVTRQVLICTLDGQNAPLSRDEADLLARSLEGQFIGFARIPGAKGDTEEMLREKYAAALRDSLNSGRPLLVDSLRTPTAYLHSFLMHFAMGEKKEKIFMPAAMAVAAVPVNDTVLFVTVSSLPGQEDVEPHLAWVKVTASDFADMLVQANKPEKKK